MNKLNAVLNIIIGTIIGTFIGYVICKVWYLKKYPSIYMMQPSPWYIGILVRGFVTILVILICMLIKAVIKRNVPGICAAGALLILLIPVTVIMFNV